MSGEIYVNNVMRLQSYDDMMCMLINANDVYGNIC